MPLVPTMARATSSDLVAGGLDDFEFDLVAFFAQQRRNVVGLPEGELRSAGTDAQAGHLVFRSRLAAATFFSFSCRLKSRRTRSTTVVACGSRAAVFRVLMGVCMILLTMPRVSASMASLLVGRERA